VFLIQNLRCDNAERETRVFYCGIRCDPRNTEVSAKRASKPDVVIGGAWYTRVKVKLGCHNMDLRLWLCNGEYVWRWQGLAIENEMDVWCRPLGGDNKLNRFGFCHIVVIGVQRVRLRQNASVVDRSLVSPRNISQSRIVSKSKIATRLNCFDVGYASRLA